MPVEVIVFDWLNLLFTASDAWIVAGIFAATTAGWLALAAVRFYLRHLADHEFENGFDLGYLRGRRDERAETSARGLPRGEALYPMIVETSADGSQRRRDR